MAAVSAPVILGCDLNDEPGGDAWTVLADGLLDAGADGGAATYPAHGPRRRIDAIMVDPRIRIERFEAVDSEHVRRASDHLPIVSDVALPVIA